MNPADTKAWLSAYHTQGYVVLKNVIDIETVEATKAACNVLVDALADRLVCFNKDGRYMTARWRVCVCVCVCCLTLLLAVLSGSCHLLRSWREGSFIHLSLTISRFVIHLYFHVGC